MDALKTILIAEDDNITRKLLTVGLSGAVEYRILAVSNGAEALDLFKRETIDLLITDLRMPVLDGFALIAVVRQLYSRVPMIVITVMEESEHRNLPLIMGVDCLIPKPLRLAKVNAAVQSLLNGRPSRGNVQGLSLAGVLQLMEWERKDATLELYCEGKRGTVFVSTGQVIHASHDDLTGLAAVRAILSWQEPSISFVAKCDVERSIVMPLTEMLLTSALRTDHAKLQEDPP